MLGNFGGPSLLPVVRFGPLPSPKGSAPISPYLAHFFTACVPPSHTSIAGNYLDTDAKKCVPCAGFTLPSSTIILITVVVAIAVVAVLYKLRTGERVDALTEQVSSHSGAGSVGNAAKAVIEDCADEAKAAAKTHVESKLDRTNDSSMTGRLELFSKKVSPKIKIMVAFGQLGTWKDFMYRCMRTSAFVVAMSLSRPLTH